MLYQAFILLIFSSIFCSCQVTEEELTNSDPLEEMIEEPASEFDGISDEETDEITNEETDQITNEDIFCPIAEVNNSNFTISPLSIVELNASASRAANEDDPLVSFEWIIVNRPIGSYTQVVESFTTRNRPQDGGQSDDLSTPEALFYADLVGNYELHLLVTSASGLENLSEDCQHQGLYQVNIQVQPQGGIMVQTVWDTPADEDQTDTDGTDLDLHLLHPNAQGQWGHDHYDAYFANPNPDWGAQGPANNPSLDIDDINGAGPEAIFIAQPELSDQTEFPGPYKVGVYYYSSNIFEGNDDSSIVTTSIFLEGDLSETFVRDLVETDFWEVADITWTLDQRSVELIDRVYDDMPLE